MRYSSSPYAYAPGCKTTMSLLYHYLLYALLLITTIFAEHLVILKPSETFDLFMKYDTTFPLSQRIKSHIHKLFHIGNFFGFAGNFTKAALERLKNCPMVAEITPDIMFRALETQEQKASPQHLVKLSQWNRRAKRGLYFYGNKGSGVNAYILDSGVKSSHPEFEGRVVEGADFTSLGFGDDNGHGTHVAGIIGSKTYGVAKNVNIIDVKALDRDGQGLLSVVLAAIEFAVNHRKNALVPGVVNLSLGAAKSAVINRVIDAASETGLVFVVAAGNSNTDACLTSPASAKMAITVGAVDDSTNGIAEFSNWGSCVDIFASGVSVASVNIHDLRLPQILSGTSMAAPIVAGLAAGLLGSGISAFDIKENLIDLGHKGKISNASLRGKGMTANLIAYNGMDPDEDSSDDTGDDD